MADGLQAKFFNVKESKCVDEGAFGEERGDHLYFGTMGGGASSLNVLSIEAKNLPKRL